MAKVSPYHSTNVDDPDVYHDYDNCPPGSQIPSKFWASGKGGYVRCGQCIRMD